MATIGVAFCVWFARLAGICMGSWIGAWMGGTPVEYRRKVWQGMITQVLLWLQGAACNLQVSSLEIATGSFGQYDLLLMLHIIFNV